MRLTPWDFIDKIHPVKGQDQGMIKESLIPSSIKSYQAARFPEDRSTFCHAPSICLNFEQNGNVTACCYNRKFVLGRYPTDSIGTIWRGDRARELRRALKAGDLSKGCD